VPERSLRSRFGAAERTATSAWPTLSSTVAAMSDVDRLAAVLADARAGGTVLDDLDPGLVPSDLDEAYAVQDRLVELLGAPVVGWKVAFSEAGTQAAFGMDRPAAGPLVGDALLSSGTVIDLASWPGRATVECEIGVRLGAPLEARDGPFDRETVATAVATVVPTIEVPALRFADPRVVGAFGIIADNVGAQAVVIGTETPLAGAGDLAAVAVTVEIDGAVVATGRGGTALGHPLESLAWLANHLVARGLGLPAGAFVSTGALTGIHQVEPGTRVAADYGALGRVEVGFRGRS
jgi:2-keto-4-pentenoate hydratase